MSHAERVLSGGFVLAVLSIFGVLLWALFDATGIWGLVWLVGAFFFACASYAVGWALERVMDE